MEIANTKLTLYGRIHPERTQVGLGGDPLHIRVRNLEGEEVSLKVLICAGQIIASIDDLIGKSILDMRNMLQEVVQHIVDCVGWELGCSYTVEISGGSLTNSVDGLTDRLLLFDVEIPALINPTRSEEVRSILNWTFEGTRDLRPLYRALGDIRQTSINASDTPFHCFRAVEALMYHFERNPRRGRPRLCEALRVDTAWILERLEIPAGLLRHGGVRTVSDQERADAISAAAEVIGRFIVLLRRNLSQLPEAEFKMLTSNATIHDDD